MRKPQSVKSLENFGRVRLSKSFYMRDFLYSEISNYYGVPNIPDNPDIAIEACSKLCEELLEPLNEAFLSSQDIGHLPLMSCAMKRN